MTHQTEAPVKEALEIDALAPDPRDEWRRMLRFCLFDEAARRAAMPTVEALLKRAHETVVSTYDYLSRVPETAAILGWETRVDPAHLEERRRFFAVWLTRTLALDCSDEFALYLFKAGRYHAGDGPRQIHTPDAYISGSIGHMLAAFAAQAADAGLPGGVIGPAMAAWSRYLSVQLNQMLFGYRLAMDMKRGSAALHFEVFGRLRPLVDERAFVVRTEDGAPIRGALRKFFNYFPLAREQALGRVWRSEESLGSQWVDVQSSFVPRYGWRVLVNGRDVEYLQGFDTPVRAGDEVSIFPPGR